MAISEPAPRSMLEVKSAEEVWDDWSLQGVVTGGETGDADTDVSREVSGYKNDVRPVDRLLNMVIKGVVEAVNVWGEVASQTELWLILKKVARSEIRATPTAPAGSYLLDPNGSTLEHARQTDVLSKNPFQLVPYASVDNDGVPPIDALSYHDEFGVCRRGLPIYVGRVQDHRTTSIKFKNLTQQVPYNTRVVSGPLPTIRIRLALNSKQL